MLFSILCAINTLAALSLNFSLVSANSVPTADQELSKRNWNEALYLANCIVDSGPSFGSASQIVYYSNGRSGSQHGELPNDWAWLASVVTWEGQAQTGTFHNSGASATTWIRSGAGNYKTGAFAGTARNSYGQNFNCYKDNYRVLYDNTIDNGQSHNTCRSIYYCFDA